MHSSIISINNFCGYFGTADTACIPIASGTQYIANHYSILSSIIEVPTLTTLSQIHSTQGIILNKQNNLCGTQGDFIITHTPHQAVGVWTADCLPIFVYDAANNIIAAVHAGWKGAVYGIINNLIECMTQAYKSSLENVYFLLGPSAQGCCYTISNELAYSIYKEYPLSKSLYYYKNIYYFDLKTLIVEQLIKYQVSSSLIIIDQRCTICQPFFYSYRNNAKTPMRQINVCWLS